MQVTYWSEKVDANYWNRCAEVEGIIFCALPCQAFYVRIKNHFAVVRSILVTEKTDMTPSSYNGECKRKWSARIEKADEKGFSVCVSHQIFPNQDDAFIWTAKELLKLT